MKNNNLFFCLVILLLSVTGCSTMNQLNPFSDEDKTTVMNSGKATNDKVKIKKVQCYAWDISGMCTVW